MKDFFFHSFKKQATKYPLPRRLLHGYPKNILAPYRKIITNANFLYARCHIAELAPCMKISVARCAKPILKVLVGCTVCKVCRVCEVCKTCKVCSCKKTARFPKYVYMCEVSKVCNVSNVCNVYSNLPPPRRGYFTPISKRHPPPWRRVSVENTKGFFF